MIKVILNGAGGRMGREVEEILLNGEGDAVLAAAVDKNVASVPYSKLSEYTGDADVIIDFSHHSATNEIVSYAMARKLPVVIAPTGHTDEEKALINEAAKSIPVFFSANLSLGVAVLVNLAKKAAALFPDADIEIVEAHHNRKADAPSGTAKMIADALCQVRPEAELVYGRCGMQKREKNEIGIHALRLGNNPGMHQVIIATDSQTLTLQHQAESRSVFADGAITCAKYLVNCAPGLYNMETMLSEVLK